jgi:hypothetical protein
MTLFAMSSLIDYGGVNGAQTSRLEAYPQPRIGSVAPARNANSRQAERQSKGLRCG